MSSTLLTSYGEYDAAIDRILSLAQRRIDLFDHDLARLKLDQPGRHAALLRLLGGPGHRLRIVVQNGQAAMSRHPLLLRLLESHGHQFSLLEADEKLAHLSDSLLVADGVHALVRFHRDQPRGKLLEDEADEVRPYERKFQSIVDEGATPLSPRVAGL